MKACMCRFDSDCPEHGLRPSAEPAGRYATGLTGAAYNLLAAIEHGDRANVHGWSIALRKELDAYLLPTQASDSKETT